MSRRLTRLSLLGLSMALFAAVPAAEGAVSHALIQGSGSSWSSNAVNQWIADVQPNGLQVVYTANGSAQGRNDFANKTTDFAVSDIGYQGRDPVSGQNDTSLGRQYAYLPVVAGGTAFPYHIQVEGSLVQNLRLSGSTLAKIFTNQITNWDDPTITADNNGRVLPNLAIVPVVHSEGSGSSAQFTTYLDTQYSSMWRTFLGSNCALAAGKCFTEYFPRSGNNMIAQNGSDGVMNFIASAAANGAIGYDEYSYALAKTYPVVKLENSAGYFTLPTQYNVAVALTQALINENSASPDYLLQDLHKVFVYNDKRTYAMSSYSYMIIPTASNDSTMTTAKRQTLADYLYFSLCQGQSEMGKIGYSPLPVNLVQASFNQTAKLKAADSGVDLTNHNVANCNNPTFVAGNPTRNYLAEIAPIPPICDASGHGPCTEQGDSGTGSTPNPTGGPTTNPTGGTGGGGIGGGGAGIGGGGANNNSGGGGTSNVAAVPVNLSAYDSGTSGLLGPLAVLLLAGALIAPPLLWQRLGRTPGPR